MQKQGFTLTIFLFLYVVEIHTFAQNNIIEELIRNNKHNDALTLVEHLEEDAQRGTESYHLLQKYKIQCQENLTASFLNSYINESKDLYGDNSIEFNEDLLWIASYLYDEGDLVQSKHFLKLAKLGLKQFGTGPFQGRDTLQNINVLDLEGRLYVSSRRAYRGIRYLIHSSELRRKCFGENNLHYIDGLISVANAYIMYSNPQKAVEYHNKALSSISENVKRSFREFDEQGREQYWNIYSRYYEGTLDAMFFLPKLSRQAHKIANYAYNAILVAKSALLEASSSGREYEYVTIDEIQNSLNEHDVCIEFFKTRTNNYGALIIKKGWPSAKLVRLNATINIDGNRANIHEALPYTPPEHEYNDYTDYLYSLGRAIWPEELTSFFPNKDEGRVYYATAGKLDLCPIDCLPMHDSNNRNRQYYGQCYNMVRLTSTRELVTHSKHIDNVLDNVSLFGGMNYRMTSDTVSYLSIDKEANGFVRHRDYEYEKYLSSTAVMLRDRSLAPLPGSLQEIIQVDSILNHQANLLTGKFATRNNIQKLSEQSSTIVISTHGFSNRLSVQNANYYSFDDPLQRCGLLLSGREGGETLISDTRYICARDIVKWNLSELRLAILASCSSLGNDLQKDGIYGLMRAFKLAGAQSVIVSSWQISDEVTEKFITLLFDNIIQTYGDVHKAFCMSREKIKNSYPDSFYWSSFILIDAQ